MTEYNVLPEHSFETMGSVYWITKAWSAAAATEDVVITTPFKHVLFAVVQDTTATVVGRTGSTASVITNTLYPTTSGTLYIKTDTTPLTSGTIFAIGTF